jgi:hypothetical protein
LLSSRWFFQRLEESVYGDQGQEVAWEVQERFIAKRQQEIEEHEVTRQIRRGRRREQFAQRVLDTLDRVREEWPIGEYKAERGNRLHS